MYWYEQEVRELEASLARRPAPPCPAVFYGSSSIRLWTALAEDLVDPRAVNLGFGGATLEACVYFFERLVLPLRPCSLVVYAGDNDLGDGRSAEDVLRSFRALIAKVTGKLPGIPFGFISIKLSPARFDLQEKIEAANRSIEEEISRHEGCWFVDICHAMLGSGGEPRRELFSPDGLHLSREGEKLWARLLEPRRAQIFTGNYPLIHPGTRSAPSPSREGESRVP